MEWIHEGKENGEGGDGKHPKNFSNELLKKKNNNA